MADQIEHIYFITELEEMQVLKLFQDIISTLQENDCVVEEAKLMKHHPGKSYTHDGLEISGWSFGRRFRMELELEDKEEDDRDES